VRVVPEQRAKQLADAWTRGLGPFFRATLVRQEIDPRDGHDPGHANVYPLGPETYLIIVWRGDKSLLEASPWECIADGAVVNGVTKGQVARDAVDLLMHVFDIE